MRLLFVFCSSILETAKSVFDLLGAAFILKLPWKYLQPCLCMWCRRNLWTSTKRGSLSSRAHICRFRTATVVSLSFTRKRNQYVVARATGQRIRSSHWLLFINWQRCIAQSRDNGGELKPGSSIKRAVAVVTRGCDPKIASGNLSRCFQKAGATRNFFLTETNYDDMEDSWDLCKIACTM